METDREKVGRPRTYGDGTRVKILAQSRVKLQPKSDRRRIIDIIIENGGSMTLAEIDETMGFDCRSRVMALIYNQWLTVTDEEPLEQIEEENCDE